MNDLRVLQRGRCSMVSDVLAQHGLHGVQVKAMDMYFAAVPRAIKTGVGKVLASDQNSFAGIDKEAQVVALTNSTF